MIAPTEPVQWLRWQESASTDERGTPQDDFVDQGMLQVFGVAPGPASEVDGHRTIMTATVYAPPGVIFDGRDRVIWRGALFEVLGETMIWRFMGRDFGTVTEIKWVRR